jgi:thiamine-monophosphate kinase
MTPPLNEFEIIKRFFTRPVKDKSHFPLENGDDTALISAPAGYDLATSIDTIASGRHFPENSDPGDIGYKSLAVSLSDLAAMGAQPAAVLLALTIPAADEAWLEKFSNYFFALADQFNVELLGGNMTKGPLSVTTTVYGWVPEGKALRRSGANTGDDIYVTGNLGGAGLALKQLHASGNIESPELQQRFFRPYPRIHAGIALRDIATAAIDISDGLAADLGKLLDASRAGGEIRPDWLPLPPIIRQQCTPQEALALALYAGEDYELCFTAPPSTQRLIEEIFQSLDCSAQRLGTVTAELGLKLKTKDGILTAIPKLGFQHF